MFIPHETVTVSSEHAILLAVKRSVLRRCFSQVSLKLCRTMRLDTLISWMTAKLSDENLSDGEVQTVKVQGDVWSSYQRSIAYYLKLEEPDAASEDISNPKPRNRTALQSSSRPNTNYNLADDDSRIEIDESDVERMAAVMSAAENLKSELNAGISKLQRRVADLRQLKRDLPEKRIGGTITQPHFADAELDMLFTSLPAKTTNALEYIAFQERYTRHVAACSATYEASVVARATIPGASRSLGNGTHDMFLTACRENGESVAMEDDTSNWVMELDCLDAADEDKHAVESGSTAAARNQKVHSGSRLLLSPTSRFLNTTVIESKRNAHFAIDASSNTLIRASDTPRHAAFAAKQVVLDRGAHQ